MREGRAAADGLNASPARAGTVDARFALVVLLTLVAALLGGASRENAWRLALVELCGLTLAAITVRRLAHGEPQLGREARWPLTILASIIAIPLLQLVPLPPALWTELPGQAPRTEALALAGLREPWLPVSLSPGDTGRAVLFLIPPAAMFAATLSLGPGERRRLAWLWIALAAAGLALGLAQVVEPTGGPAYLYQTTNFGSLVGLFANRNHEAGFLLSLLPFAGALAAGGRPGGASRGGRVGAVAPAWLAWAFVLVVIVALGVIRSRAGLLLAGPAALTAAAVAWRGRDRRVRSRAAAAIVVAFGLAAVAVSVFGLDPILARFGRPAAEFRFEAWPYVVSAARGFLPLGSGVGSFDRVFEAVEPLSLVGPTYFNHAHNDYLELWLETGLVGAAILAVFLAWFISAGWNAWRRGPPLAQASSAAIALLMLQSAVDYPLRTETLAVVFAFCCGVLATPGPPIA
jgi:O-antigen ligase